MLIFSMRSVVRSADYGDRPGYRCHSGGGLFGTVTKGRLRLRDRIWERRVFLCARRCQDERATDTWFTSPSWALASLGITI